MARPPVVSVVGPSGVGKTAFLEALTRELRRRGYRVGYIKHTHHRGLLPDEPGKDSYRLARAGATVTALAGPGLLVVRSEEGVETPLCRVLALLEGEVDIVLAEGYRSLPVPKIELYQVGVTPFPGPPAGELLAVVGDPPPGSPVPAYRPDQTGAVADLLQARLGLAGEGKRP